MEFPVEEWSEQKMADWTGEKMVATWVCMLANSLVAWKDLKKGLMRGNLLGERLAIKMADKKVETRE